MRGTYREPVPDFFLNLEGDLVAVFKPLFLIDQMLNHFDGFKRFF